MTPLTDNQRRALVDLSDGEWRNLVGDHRHTMQVVANLGRRGLIREDHSHLRLDERHYTITPAGMAALEASQ